MTTESTCPACGGFGWVEVRTRGMCGCETDFDEVERTPCDVCGARLELDACQIEP